eukprot:CAMPEP_0182498182 /NCGR_PEP_ID=MMETSP1321-20130603/6466_1 /TAXON_ID=91990 /ORGANISM="Bolidomonas sp., Strain RCC1657" /LENGTH=114 /DNA_ID=CAMNT_0024702209 /DNA_START=93 /DNA_END=434 /DNA_ORIENTATION=-
MESVKSNERTETEASLNQQPVTQRTQDGGDEGGMHPEVPEEKGAEDVGDVAQPKNLDSGEGAQEEATAVKAEGEGEGGAVLCGEVAADEKAPPPAPKEGEETQEQVKKEEGKEE